VGTHLLNDIDMAELPKEKMEIRVKMETLSFFDLPREILHLILRYLHVKDLGKFDTVITNHHLRPIYFSLVDGMTIARYRFDSEGGDEDLDYCDTDYSQLEWLLLRKILPRGISLLDFHPLMLPLIINSKPHLETLRFQ
jgi:hypothetical protein